MSAPSPGASGRALRRVLAHALGRWVGRLAPACPHCGARIERIDCAADLPEDYYADSGARREGCRVAVTVPAAPGERWQVDVHAPRRYGGRHLAGYLLDSAAEALWVAGREAQGEDAGPLAMARFRRGQSLGAGAI